jgi:hypothetical protein
MERNTKRLGRYHHLSIDNQNDNSSLVLCAPCLGRITLNYIFSYIKMIVMGTASNPKRSSTKEHRCDICGRIFESAETLNSDKRMDHGQEGRHTPAHFALTVPAPI